MLIFCQGAKGVMLRKGMLWRGKLIEIGQSN